MVRFCVQCLILILRKVEGREIPWDGSLARCCFCGHQYILGWIAMKTQQMAASVNDLHADIYKIALQLQAMGHVK
jgi:hypothetical protein